jgi:hypothetical protein
MAVTILTHAQVMMATSSSSGAAVDISAQVRSLEFTRNYDIHDVTTMGNTDRQRRSGIAEYAFNTTVLQAFSTGTFGGSDSLDEFLNTLADVGQGGNTFYGAIRPDSRVGRGPANPEYAGQFILESYSPISGAVGDALEMSVPFISAGSLTRDVTTS